MEERFILQQSQEEGYWVATDIEHGIVLKFREHHVNEDQKVTLLSGSTFSSVNEATKVATYLREMGDWLRHEHYDICMPSLQARREDMGQLIRKLRIERGMTISEVATAAGVTPSNLSRIECGKYSPTLDTINRVAYALGSKIEIVPI